MAYDPRAMAAALEVAIEVARQRGLEADNVRLRAENAALKRQLGEKEVCEVERIVDQGVLGGDTAFLKVKWVNYPEPSWEPAVNVVGADDAIAEFLVARTRPDRRSRSRSPRRGVRVRFSVAPRSSPDVTQVTPLRK